MKNNEIYVSIDIETDGPIPGSNSMLSLGSAAFDIKTKKLVDTWSCNLELLPGAKPDPKTQKEFWDKNPKAWEVARLNPLPIQEAMDDYVVWLKGLEKIYKGRVVAVAAPAGFDFTYVYWYLIKFTGQSPFSFSCIDVKTFAMSLLNLPYRKSGKRNYPKWWFPKNNKHTHIALDDAIEQGEIFMNMKRYQEKIIKGRNGYNRNSKY